MGKWTYHITHSYKDKDGTHVSFVSQQYQVGVYGIVNNDPAMQIVITAADMVALEKKLKLKEKKGEITELVFGREITVSNEDGLYKEVK